MSVRANLANIYLGGMRDRSMRNGAELVREIQLADWSTAGEKANLSDRSSGVQISRDICTHFRRYLCYTKCTWIIVIERIQMSYMNWSLLIQCHPTISLCYQCKKVQTD